jgi:leader peptidase (prepilin peptidase)/N-methyltransferase
MVNLFFILMSVYIWLNPGVQLDFWLQILLLAYFALVVVIDLEHRLILHVVSLAGAVLGLYAGFLSHGLVSTLVGGLAGLIIMYILYQGGRLFVRILAKWRDYSDVDEALGFGDVILSGVIGLMLGWPGIVLGLVLAVLLAGVVSLIFLVILIVTHRYRANLTIAYGPYLIISALILVLFKDLLQGL